MGKLRERIENFCANHRIFYKQKIKDMYLEKRMLGLILSGVEIKVHIITKEASVFGRVVYVPYIVQYDGNVELEWWNSRIDTSIVGSKKTATLLRFIDSLDNKGKKRK